MTKVRFAPSPTGHLHIGGVRTALFNWLYARNTGSKFILRIEDTDVERSTPEMAKEIINGLHWLGIDWDEEPFYQSNNFDRYREVAAKLLENGKAYRCFCSPEEIEERKKNGTNELFKYDRKCLHLSPAEIHEKLKVNTPFVIRFFIPDGWTMFKDRLHKEMKINNDELDDFVLLKSDGSPTYHLSVVTDDSDMEITDVIRGDDHISNTFKQVLLYRALELKPPKYGHLPLILGPDKKKLSKRHGETSVLEFKEKGYLPEAIVTYLAQLSWLPGDNKTIFSLADLVKRFSLQKVAKSSPVFDYDKLRFLNSRAIQQADPERIYHMLCEDETFASTYSNIPIEKKVALVELVKPRMKTVEEFKEKFKLYLNPGTQPLPYHNNELEKLNLKDPNQTIHYLQGFLAKLQDTTPFTSTAIEETLRNAATEMEIKAADLIHPSRFALTAETVSPSIFDVFEFLGKEESLKRIQDFLSFLAG